MAWIRTLLLALLFIVWAFALPRISWADEQTPAPSPAVVVWVPVGVMAAAAGFAAYKLTQPRTGIDESFPAIIPWLIMPSLGNVLLHRGGPILLWGSLRIVAPLLPLLGLLVTDSESGFTAGLIVGGPLLLGAATFEIAGAYREAKRRRAPLATWSVQPRTSPDGRWGATVSWTVVF